MLAHSKASVEEETREQEIVENARYASWFADGQELRGNNAAAKTGWKGKSPDSNVLGGLAVLACVMD